LKQLTGKNFTNFTLTNRIQYTQYHRICNDNFNNSIVLSFDHCVTLFKWL